MSLLPKISLCLTIVVYTLPRLLTAQSGPSVTVPLADTTTQPKPAVATTLDLNQALSVSELKIEMAESSWKIKKDFQTLIELTNALEKYLNENCFGDLLRTLSYVGPPTDPNCIARMERLLDIYPENPVAICLRDGIEAHSCRDAYRSQSTKQFSSTSTTEGPDDALRAGLSAADTEKLRAIEETLENAKRDYQRASSDDEKQKHLDDTMHLYDKALSIACRIVGTQLEDPTSGQEQEVEDSSIQQIREKLLKVPPALRGDYQNRLLTEAEEELAKARNDPQKRIIAQRKIDTILKPEIDERPKTAGKIRYRVVLPQCYDLVAKVTVLAPKLPSAACHRDGWQSPQCVTAVKKWNDYRAKVAERKRRKEKRDQPTPESQISSF